MQAGNESDAVSNASSQNNVMPSRHVTCGLIEAMVNGELRYIIGGRSNGGMGGLTGELPARRFDAERVSISYTFMYRTMRGRVGRKTTSKSQHASTLRQLGSFSDARKLLWSNRLLLSSYLRGQVNVYHLTRTSVFDPRRAVTYLPTKNEGGFSTAEATHHAK